MLSVSIIETNGFREFINAFDPCFRIPTRYKLKETCLPSTRHQVTTRMLDKLYQIPFPNISLDGWSDAAMLHDSRLKR
jgi:hypothetical protein